MKGIRTLVLIHVAVIFGERCFQRFISSRTLLGRAAGSVLAPGFRIYTKAWRLGVRYDAVWNISATIPRLKQLLT